MALVVIVLGMAATKPRAEPTPALVVAPVPATRCDAVAPDRRHACLRGEQTALAR